MTRSVTIYLQSFRLSVCFRPILASPIQAYQVCSDSERCCTDCHRHRTRKYDQGLSHLLHTELHGWTSRSGSCINLLWWSTDHRYLQDKAPQYLSNCCVPVSEVASRQQLRSASHHQLLLIPRYRLRTFGRRAFAVAGPTFWNSLADELRTYSSDRFKLVLKISSLPLTSVFRALGASAVMRMIDIDNLISQT